MRRAVLITITSMVLAAGQTYATDSLTELSQDEQQATARCRQAFPASVAAPDQPGGWFIEKSGALELLCLYGSLELIDLTDIDATLAGRSIDLTIARSTGGPASHWLGLAEILEGKVSAGIVDEACFSSCATYLIPILDRVVAPRDSLIVWHGGPTSSATTESAARIATISELIDYQDLADRTEALYLRHGILRRLLDDTSRLADPGKLDAYRDWLPVPLALSGYALSPQRLAECYNLRSTSGLWHAGSDRDVFELGRRRSGQLMVLESPFPDESCDAKTEPKP